MRIVKDHNVSKTRITTLIVCTLRGRSCELAAALKRRRIDLCAVQETRWSGSKSKELGHGFKIVYNGSPKTRNGVGIIFSQRFRDSRGEVQRFDDCLMKVVIITADQCLHFFPAYAPGCCDQVKDDFWMFLDEKTAEVPEKDTIVVAGDLNGHADTDAMEALGTEHGMKMASTSWNMLTLTTSLAIMNTKFWKRSAHLISYYSGNVKIQIDFVLARHRDQELATNAEVAPCETVANLVRLSAP